MNFAFSGCSFGCGQEFYDMNRPEPTCPAYNEDQRDRPLHPPAPTPVTRKAPAVRPMAPLLDEEEELEPAAGETEGAAGPGERTPDPGGAIFDDPGVATESED